MSQEHTYNFTDFEANESVDQNDRIVGYGGGREKQWPIYQLLTAASNAAIETASADAMAKANAAQQAAIEAAAEDATSKAETAKQAAISISIDVARQLANNAENAAVGRAGSDASAIQANAISTAVAVAASDATAKANAAQQAAIEAAAEDATAKAAAAKADAIAAIDPARSMRGLAKKSWAMRVGSANFSAPAQLRILTLGDSLAVDPGSMLSRQMVAKYGLVGFYGILSSTSSCTGGTSFLFGGAAITSTLTNYAVTPTSDWVNVSAGQSVSFTVETSRNGNASPYQHFINRPGLKSNFPRCNLVRVAYVAEAGAGTFSVEYTRDGSSWLPVAGLTNINAATGSGLICTSVAMTESFVCSLRVIGVTGTVKAYAIGAESTTLSGVILQGVHRGSIQLGSDGFAGCPYAQTLINTLAPDLVLFAAADGDVRLPNGTGGIAPAIAAINTLLGSGPDQVLFGIASINGYTAAEIDAYNTAMREHCGRIGANFIDTAAILGDYTSAAAYGFMRDGTHPSAMGTYTVIQSAVRKLGLDAEPYGADWSRAPRAARNLWIGDMGAWPGGFSRTATVASGGYLNMSDFNPGFNWVIYGAATVMMERVALTQLDFLSNERYGLHVTAAVTGEVANLRFSCGPARFFRGRQITVSFWAKTAGATYSIPLLLEGWSGVAPGATIQSQENVRMGPTWKRYCFTTEVPPFNSTETTSDSSVTLMMNIGSFDFTIANMQVVEGCDVGDGLRNFQSAETVVVDFGGIPPGSTYDFTINMPGVKQSQRVRVARPGVFPAGLICDAAVTSEYVVKLFVSNFSATTIDPPSCPFVFYFD